MDRNAVIATLETLATDANLSTEVLYAEETRSALREATALLKQSASRRSGNTSLTAAGTAWSKEEDERLAREFDASMSIAQIALQHGRTSSAISLRLVKLGKIDPAAVKARDRGARVA